MQNDIDPQLLALFARSHETLPSEAFMRTFLAKLERAQRLRTLQLAGLAAVLLLIGVWFAPSVLEHTALAIRAAGVAMGAASEYTGPYERLVVSPLGWVVSTLIGLAVLFRVGALRRR
jgi:hypothetical protein